MLAETFSVVATTELTREGEGKLVVSACCSEPRLTVALAGDYGIKVRCVVCESEVLEIQAHGCSDRSCCEQ